MGFCLILLELEIVFSQIHWDSDDEHCGMFIFGSGILRVSVVRFLLNRNFRKVVFKAWCSCLVLGWFARRRWCWLPPVYLFFSLPAKGLE